MTPKDDPDDEVPARRVYSVPAAEKVLDILEFMADRAEGLTATEIANQMGRSVHEIYRVLLLLESRGYLYQRAASDGYRLTLKLFDLAHRLPSVRRLSDSALEEMQDLAPRTMQSCHLGVLNGHELLIVLQVDSPLPMRYSVVLGAKFDFAETSAGTVIFAHLPPTQQDRMLSRMAAEGRDPGEIALVRSRAKAIRTVGYEMRESLAVTGVTNIAAPIFDHLGQAVAAMTVPYVPQRAAIVPMNEVRDMTLVAARRISLNLGAQAGAP
jgi:DNA-binding IclR family transcriptional regulator